MKRRKSRHRLPYLVFGSLICVYLWVWARLSSSPVLLSAATIDKTPRLEGGDKALSPTSKVPPYVIPEIKKGTTLIVAFCNFHFREVGLKFYKRMTRLGYSNHLLVATDDAMVDFLENYSELRIRYQVWIHEPIPAEVSSWPKQKQDHAYLQLLMAVRWKYLLRRLESGMHIVLTDVDNIFTRFVDVDQEIAAQDTEVDVWHAYATKFPRKAFAKQGFCVCSGMSWWRASPGGVRFARLMRDTCGDMCDDQRQLNNLLSSSPKLNMTWHWTKEAKQSRITNTTTVDPRFLGLPTAEMAGHSDVTGHKAKIWTRDFAFRGPLVPDICPTNNWVSMPILDAKSRQSAWKTKIESFQEWDRHCGSEL
jgi:hypothetical protein